MEDSLHKWLDNPEKVHRWEQQKIRKYRTIMWVKEAVMTVKSSYVERNIFIVCEDTAVTRELAWQLSYQATHDSLTDLINRREFEERLNTMLKTCTESGGQHTLCYMDLDQFKIINDTSGHTAGDELLEQLGLLLQHQFRTRDTIVRLEGDEFGILMEHCPLY